MSQQISVSAKAAVIRDGHVLVVRYKSPQLHYNLPGGKLLNGEGLHDAVKRKLREECSADVKILGLLYVFEHLPSSSSPQNDYQKVQFNFLAELLSGSEPAMPAECPDPNQDGIDWLPLSKLTAAPLKPPVAFKLTEVLSKRHQAEPLLTDAPI